MDAFSKQFTIGKTGVLDKHGNEIKEGDIVEISSGSDHYADYVGVVRRQSISDYNTGHGIFMIGSRTVYANTSVQYEIIGRDARPKEDHRRNLV